MKRVKIDKPNRGYNTRHTFEVWVYRHEAKGNTSEKWQLRVSNDLVEASGLGGQACILGELDNGKLCIAKALDPEDKDFVLTKDGRAGGKFVVKAITELRPNDIKQSWPATYTSDGIVF